MGMAVRRLISDIRELRAEIRDLLAAETRAEEQARLDLTVSTRRFSRRARHVVDDKLTFSATLLRAGEVDAAQRLLEEVEQEVRDGEIALIEQVNEVRVARAVRRERLTRLRLARSLAVAIVGSLVLSSGAVAMSVAGFVSRLGESTLGLDVASPEHPARAEAAPLAKAAVEALKRKGVGINKVRELLSPEELATLEQLVVTQAPSSVIEQFLLARLPGTVGEVRKALAEITAAAAPGPLPLVVAEPEKKKRTKKKAAGKAAQPQPEPTPDPEPTPEPEPSPSEEPSNQGGGKGDGDGGQGTGTDEGKSGGLPSLPSP